MDYNKEYARWLASGALSGEERAELNAIAADEKEKESRFCMQLEFGTAGLRGVMGTGTNRMNIHVIRHATQAFAEVILAEGGEAAAAGVAIAYDCRVNSDVFAREAACVIAANGIRVRIFESLRPTPELSFAIREYGCIAGINVTASHNPKEYNGYKVYWSDGAQLPPHHASEIAARMAKNDVFDSVKRMEWDAAVSAGLVTVIGAETDERFLENVMGQVIDPDVVPAVADGFKMVYTPFHGAGHLLIPEALRRLGMKHVFCVPEQMVIDGTFPTVKSPNPENPEGFYIAVDIARREGADFILGSDPDADRVGIMVRNADGAYITISGNQTGALLLDYVINARKKRGTLPDNAVALKTIVTTEMARTIAERSGVKCFDTFTGFKFIAEKKNQLEGSGEGKVIFSYEESYGYMLGDYVRDKDAVTASVLLTEMAAWYHSRGMTLCDALQELYAKYGYYGERTVNLVMPGLDGLKKMKALMAGLRETPPALLAGVPLRLRRDYLSGEETEVGTGRTAKMELSESNVLSYVTEDGTTVLVRPSGTEPKVKVYILTNGASAAECAARVEQYAAWAESLKG